MTIAAFLALALGLATWTPTAGAGGIGFSLDEKEIISAFFGVGGKQDKGGKGNKGGKGDKAGKGKGVGSQGLPPGLAMNGKMPPGIAKRQLPTTLLGRLPKPPKGFERVIVDNDILLIEIATEIIHDVITDIVK
jgi:hypothetical protein